MTSSPIFISGVVGGFSDGVVDVAVGAFFFGAAFFFLGSADVGAISEVAAGAEATASAGAGAGSVFGVRGTEVVTGARSPDGFGPVPGSRCGGGSFIGFADNLAVVGYAFGVADRRRV